MKRIGLSAITIVGLFLLYAMLHLHPVGEPNSSPMDDYFILNAQEETGANNVVSAIVFDYRGYDTLGEASILFTTVMCITLLFGRGLRI